jgi:hypothetical protein
MCAKAPDACQRNGSRAAELLRPCRAGLIDPDAARNIWAWEGSGFSVVGSIQVEPHDRRGLERWFSRYYVRDPLLPWSAGSKNGAAAKS